MLPHKISGQIHGLVSAGLVAEKAEGRAFAVPRIEPVIADEALRLANQRNEALAYILSMSALSLGSKW